MNPLLEEAMDQMELEILVAYLDVYNASANDISIERPKKKIDWTYHYDLNMYEKICN